MLMGFTVAFLCVSVISLPLSSLLRLTCWPLAGKFIERQAEQTLEL